MKPLSSFTSFHHIHLSYSSAMPLYLLRVPLSHLTFRIPSLLSVAQLYGFEIRFVSADLYRSVLVVELDKEEYVQHLLDRAILLQSATILVLTSTS